MNSSSMGTPDLTAHWKYVLSAGLQVLVGALALEALEASLSGPQKHQRRNGYRYRMERSRLEDWRGS